jgi:hypothetical protein
MAQLNQFEIRDYVTEARGLVTEQFKGKTVMDKYLRLLLSGILDAQEVLRQIQQQRSIDTAVGAQLDVIGEIVGRPRGLVTAELFEYFGFQGGPLSDTFGSLNDTTVGSAWYSLNGPLGISRAPSDEEYRLILKAKIIKNRTLATPEDVIDAYKFLFGASRVQLDETGPEICSVRIGIGKILTDVERGLLFDLGGADILLPKPVGVSYTYTEFDSDRTFATEGFPGAMGPGELSDPSTGGIVSNLLT